MDPMFFFNNLFLIHQLLCANIDGGESDDGSKYVYTEEQLMDDIKHLLDGPKQESEKRCARIVKYLKDLNYQTLGKDLERRAYKGLPILYHELPKAIQFVYKAEKFSLYFSAQQEGNVEPREGLKVFIKETKIEMMKGVFKELNRVYLTVVVRSSLQNLSDVDLGDTMQQFDFITDLYLLNLTHEYTSWDCVSYNTVQDFISLETIPRLRTLKVKHMLVTDEFLEKVSNMTLESLWFTGCVFLTSKGTVQQSGEIEVTFAKSYETICFDKCRRSFYYQLRLAHKEKAIIKVNLNKCVKLRNLTVNMDYYVSVILNKQIVDDLRYLSLGKKNRKLPLSSSQCYDARLEYLTIDTEDVELAVNFLKEINRSKLKHLVLICFIYDISNLFNLEFAALEVLEIGASNSNLELKDKSTIVVKMEKLETLKIDCRYVSEAFMQMITELEMLKHLEILVANWYFGQKILRKQLSNLKGPIEKLFVSSELTIGELVRSIEPLKTLKEFRIDGRSIRSSFDSLANRNDGKFQSAKVDANEQNLVVSKNVVHLKLHTLHIDMGLAQKELIQLMLCQYFEAFADIKKLVIDVIPKRPGVIQKLFGSMQKQFKYLIKSIFETFKQLDVLVFCYKSSHISREEAHILRKLFSSRCRSLKERCEWSDKCDEEQIIFELHK
ncbi:hypothetical protein VCUG_01772 [Vavraia culicis subsp. floridensis]|uniref:Uncharacterized protein n=1 Tax=Vavraia culicis (isolate floridensis) TaxID=948595 RepID=L2GSU5_VAVCU|nr:uncharacterized protein VCUG_01772 [Vavraia culicis subsp. floridensis]ELA46746.1 hypothetical protein VCUG_01772 [Vavraia culicis subsp. floridensis]